MNSQSGQYLNGFTLAARMVSQLIRDHGKKIAGQRAWRLIGQGRARQRLSKTFRADSETVRGFRDGIESAYRREVGQA